MNFKFSVVKSLVGSIIFKMGSSLMAFISVPMLLGILGTDNYGIWVTLTGLLAWLNLFDFGSGYSLKNKITETLGLEHNFNLDILIAGTIQIYLLATFVILFFFIGSLFFWDLFKNNLELAILIYVPVILSFPFTLGHFMLQGLKKFNLFNSLLLIQSVIWLVFILLFKFNIIISNLHIVALVYSFLYVIINLIIFYISLKKINFKWKQLYNFNNLLKSKASLLVGGRFFLLQISSLLLFSLGNVMTYNHLQLKDVSQFDTVNKIYIFGLTIFNVIVSVFWAEISSAKSIKNILGLKKLRVQMLLLASVFCLGTIGVTFIMPFFIPYWTGGGIKVRLEQLFPFALLASIQFYAYAGAVFLNAFEDLRGQIVMAVIASAFIIPLSKYFFNLNFGIGSVPVASAMLMIPSLVYVHYKTGFWIKKMNKL